MVLSHAIAMAAVVLACATLARGDCRAVGAAAGAQVFTCPTTCSTWSTCTPVSGKVLPKGTMFDYVSPPRTCNGVSYIKFTGAQALGLVTYWIKHADAIYCSGYHPMGSYRAPYFQSPYVTSATSPFRICGWPNLPITHSPTNNGFLWQDDNAFDYCAPAGTSVYAIEDGTIGPQRTSNNGKSLYLNARTNQYFYQHLGEYAPGIVTGVWVTRGTYLGKVGSLAQAPGAGTPHLHFAVRDNHNGHPQSTSALRNRMDWCQSP